MTRGKYTVFDGLTINRYTMASQEDPRTSRERMTVINAITIANQSLQTTGRLPERPLQLFAARSCDDGYYAEYDVEGGEYYLMGWNGGLIDPNAVKHIIGVQNAAFYVGCSELPFQQKHVRERGLTVTKSYTSAPKSATNPKIYLTAELNELKTELKKRGRRGRRPKKCK